MLERVVWGGLTEERLNKERMEVTQISAEGAFQRVGRANVKEGASLAEREWARK